MGAGYESLLREQLTHCEADQFGLALKGEGSFAAETHQGLILDALLERDGTVRLNHLPNPTFEPLGSALVANEDFRVELTQ